jgi:hypothetical protein
LDAATQPTVTDANLLGRLDEATFLGGGIHLDRVRAMRMLRARSRVVAERLIEVIGCAGDALELAVVEPVEIAEVAGVEHDVAWACVEVGLHGAAAVRAGNVAAEIVWVGCSADGDAGVLLSAQILDEVREEVHGDEQAAAFAAEEDGRFGDRALGERDMAEGALVSRAVAEKGNAFVVLFGHYDGAAVVALEDIAGDAHLSAAGRAVHCWGVPQSGQKWAACGMA